MSETEVAQAEKEAEKGVETPRKSKLGSIKATVLKPFKGLKIGKKNKDKDTNGTTNGTNGTNGHAEDEAAETNGKEEDEPPTEKPQPPPSQVPVPEPPKVEEPIPSADE